MTRPAQRNRLLRSSLVCLLLVTTVVSVAGLGTASAQPTQQVPPRGLANHLVINEVYDSQNVALEYFELYNPLSTTINLSTYVIYNHDGNTPLSNLDNPSIAGGQLRAIGPTQLHTTTIAGSGLARTDFLGLVNTSPSDTVVDVVNWGGAPQISWPNYDRFASYFFTVGTQPFLPEDGPNAKTAHGPNWTMSRSTKAGEGGRTLDIHVGNVTLYH